METIEKDTMTTNQRRTLFWYFREAGFDEDARRDFVSDHTGGRTGSLKEVGFIEAMDMIRFMKDIFANPRQRVYNGDDDRKRKGVMRAIGEYFRRCGIKAGEEYIKATAIRAAGIAQTGCISHDFNRIDGATLTRIYNEFCRKQSVQGVKSSIPTISLN